MQRKKPQDWPIGQLSISHESLDKSMYKFFLVCDINVEIRNQYTFKINYWKDRL